MKKLLVSTALCLAATTGVATAAPAAPAPATQAAPARPDADPAMWVVRDADTTIYLFGTFHMLDNSRDWFNEEVRTAFDRSGELVLEADLPEGEAAQQQAMMPLIMRYAVDQNGRTLSSRLTAEENRKLAAALQTAGAPAAAFDRFEPWFVAMTLSALAAQRMGMTPEQGADDVLKRAARARNVPVAELEGVDAQLRIMDAIPERLQLTFMRESISYMDRVGTVLGPMQTAWYAGDIDTLARLINESMASTPELYDIMLSNRNRAWAQWIDARMDRPGTVFVAVGAGHLGGRNSVQDYLREHGHRAERVPAS